MENKSKLTIEPFVIFINDDPSLMGYLDEVLSTGIAMFKYRILENEKNLGVSRSRNRGLRYVLSYLYPGVITYFDVDDTWMPNAISNMKGILIDLSLGTDMVFSPVDNGMTIKTELLNRKVPFTEFLTKVPMQECIYFWNYEYVKNFYSEHGYLWYEDDSESKYFPEDIMFHLDIHNSAYVTDRVICKRDYSKGNITKDWDDTIRKNKSAFKNLIELHRETSKLVEYPDELKIYVNYLRELVEE
jgi:hypothetical protein